MDSLDQIFKQAVARHRADLEHVVSTRALSVDAPGYPKDWRLEEVAAAALRRECGEILANRYPPSSALLFYSATEESLDVFAVTKNRVALERRPAALRAAMSALDRIMEAMGVRDAQTARVPRRRDFVGVKRQETKTSGDANAIQSALSALSATLFPGDIASVIAMERVEHLVIVPTGSLATIPFPMLSVPGLGPLVEHASISIAPSLSDFSRNRRQAIAPFEHVLVVGNPAFDDSEYDLVALPGAEREAHAVARLLGREPIVGKDATRDAILEAGTKADLLYLATHGVADPDDPLDSSFLAFAPSAASNGRWTAREIQGQRFAARLVVLSACQTGLGGTLDGGIIGLARAFQLAGACQVVMTLWNIDDAASADLMTEMMTNLSRGFSVPQAIRLAMLAARTAGGRPAQWAPFVTFAGPFPF